MNYINLNGRLTGREEWALSPEHKVFREGLHQRQGLLETMLVRTGEIRLEAGHWQRLFSGMKDLRFFVPDYFTPEMLKQELMHCVRESGLEASCRVRLQVYAGKGDYREDRDDEMGPPDTAPVFLIECFPFDRVSDGWSSAGLVLGVADGLFKDIVPLANLKMSDRNLYHAAGAYARMHNWDDALILNTQGHIIESTIANVFWLSEGHWFTPPLSDGCVAGVMRRFVLTQLAEAGVSITERSLTPVDLERATEVFLTNAIRGVGCVQQIGERKLEQMRVAELQRLLF